MKIVRFVLLLAVSLPLFGLRAFDLEVVDPEKNAKMAWLGHSNPDCDSIAAAIGCAALYGGKAYISGTLNHEARFLLEQAKFPIPEMAGDLGAIKVGLVDHSQRLQAAETIREENVVCILDHHPLRSDSLLPARVISIDVRPSIAASAIVADRYKKAGQKPTPQVALLLLGGILSDSTNLKDDLEPQELELVSELAASAGITDVKAFGQRMLEAKSDYSKLSPRDILFSDYKEYRIGQSKVGFGVAETLTPEPLKARVGELKAILAAVKEERRLDYLFFSVKDLTAKRSFLLSAAPEEQLLAKRAYRKCLQGTDGDWLLLSKTSRKKVLIPELEKVLVP